MNAATLLRNTGTGSGVQVMRTAAPIEQLRVSAYKISTDFPESDGTYEWSHTTIVIVQASAENATSIGYSYADLATAKLIEDHLVNVAVGQSAMDVGNVWQAMVDSIRNIGRAGVAAMAISAVDNALWDLKARLLNLPLVTLLGAVRDRLPIYGSGGFTSYSNEQLQTQLAGWIEEGIPRVKMKVGREPASDLDRAAMARKAIGKSTELFVDANGAYSRKQALQLSHDFRELGVTWFEEPVSSDDLEGLRLLRDQGPPGMDIAAGEYGYDLSYFERMLNAGAVDVLQADATRCGGITGFLQAAVLCEAHHVPMSSHCAPTQHLHVGCAARPLRHAEYFHDHVRIENLLFDGVPQPQNGALFPDLSRAGNGLELKRSDVEQYRIKL